MNVTDDSCRQTQTVLDTKNATYVNILTCNNRKKLVGKRKITCMVWNSRDSDNSSYMPAVLFIEIYWKRFGKIEIYFHIQVRTCLW